MGSMARGRTASQELGWFLVGSSLFIVLVVVGSVLVTSLLRRQTEQLAGQELAYLETVLEVETRLERTRSTYLLSLPEGGETLRSYAVSFGFLANFSAARNPVDWLEPLEATRARGGPHQERWEQALSLSSNLHQTFAELGETIDPTQQEALITQAAGQASELAGILRVLREAVRGSASEVARRSSRLASLSTLVLIALGAFLLLINGLLGLLTLRRLRQSVRAIQADAERSATLASQLGGRARAMAHSSQRIRASMEEATSAAEQISRGSQQAAETVTRMSSHLAQVEHQVQEATERLAETTRDAERASRHVQTTAGHVREAAGRLRGGLGSLRENLARIRDLEGRLQGFREEMQQIHGIVRAISEIAERTRVLSFNASIEAARAGSHGRGFAVVAREIKTLSETSRESAQAIGRIVDGLASGSDQLAAQAGQVIQEVQERTEAIGGLDRLFVSLEESFRTVVDQGQRVTQLASDQEALRDEVTARLSDTAAGIQQVSAQLQETAAAMEQLHATSQRILGDNRELVQGLAQQRELSQEQERLAATVQERLRVLDRTREKGRTQAGPAITRPQEPDAPAGP